MTHETFELGKGLAAIGGAATLWASEKTLALTDLIPDMLREFGLPIMVAALSIVGFVKVLQFAQLQMEARIGDRDALLKQQQKASEKADSYRDKMLETQELIAKSIKDQTEVIETITTQNKDILAALKK